MFRFFFTALGFLTPSSSLMSCPFSSHLRSVCLSSRPHGIISPVHFPGNASAGVFLQAADSTISLTPSFSLIESYSPLRYHDFFLCGAGFSLSHAPRTTPPPLLRSSPLQRSQLENSVAWTPASSCDFIDAVQEAYFSAVLAKCCGLFPYRLGFVFIRQSLLRKSLPSS